jgi:hypothetical protein
VIISPLKRTWPFIWTNLNSLHPRIICTKFDWIWPAGSEKEDFLKFSVYFYYLPLEKGYPLLLNKLESPSPKDDLCQVWLKLVQWFWRRSRKCKSLQTDRQTDTAQWAIRKAHLSFQLRFQLRWAKKARGPGATSLTWVILANFSHRDTCKNGFTYCGPDLPRGPWVYGT